MFLMGNHPCEADCAVFGMLAMLWMLPERSFVTKILKGKEFLFHCNINDVRGLQFIQLDMTKKK